MTFENFLANSYDQNVVWVSALFIVVAIALVLGVLVGSIDPTKLTIWIAPASGLALVGVVMLAVSLANASHEIDYKNEQIAENNLKQKYDIIDVVWGESRADAQTYHSLGDITVLDKNSNILEFRYKLDRETQEPYLLNNAEDAQVKANDLLLEKSEK